ncbi:MAG: TIGR02281 family clan AA aspartic protease [Gammaproteobacteria bacterium]|nr:TIGR02281 family clan AA aspartic protease [Gammaproteobacteria bacterium]
MALRHYFAIALIFLLSFCGVSEVKAEEISVHVSGLFKDTAVVSINGNQQVLKVGQVSPEGVKLISANSLEAVFEINGRRETLTMGSSGTIGFDTEPTDLNIDKAKTKKSVSLVRQADGMFRARGTINGGSVIFLVDTGATTIAMNHYVADRASVPYRSEGQLVMVETASGMAKAYQVNLKSVRIGDLELSNVAATVMLGIYPKKILLGNSFLDKFKVEQEGNKMIISSLQ